MKPTLFELFDEPISAYFALLLVAYAVAIYVAARNARRLDLPVTTFIDIGLLSVVCGLAGARLLHIVADGFLLDYVHLCTDPTKVDWAISVHECHSIGGVWDELHGACHPGRRNCLAWLEFWNGGLVFYGGLGAGAVAGLWVARRDGVSLARTLDVTAPAIAVGLCIGRLGCLLAGCCFGTTTDAAFGMQFPAHSPASVLHAQLGQISSASQESLPVVPTQLLESTAALLIAVWLTFVTEPRKRFDGAVFLVFLAMYAVVRFVLEVFRADDRGMWGVLTPAQWISLGCLCLAAGAHRVVTHRNSTKIADVR